MAVAKYRYVYRLKAGRHEEAGVIVQKGQTFSTHLNLFSHFGPSAHDKFELIETNDPKLSNTRPVNEVPVNERPPSDTAEDEDEPEMVGDGAFEAMTVNELIAFAKDEGIDIGRAKKKATIIARIRQGLVVEEEEDEDEEPEEEDELEEEYDEEDEEDEE